MAHSHFDFHLWSVFVCVSIVGPLYCFIASERVKCGKRTKSSFIPVNVLYAVCGVKFKLSIEVRHETWGQLNQRYFGVLSIIFSLSAQTTYMTFFGMNNLISEISALITQIEITATAICLYVTSAGIWGEGEWPNICLHIAPWH